MNAFSRSVFGVVAVLMYAGLSLTLLGCPDAPGTLNTGVCLQCHDGRFATDQSLYPLGPHDFLECERCHGNGYLHVRNGGRGGLYIQNPGNLPFATHFEACDECHTLQTDQYLLSEHAEEQVVRCFDCHDPHVPTGLALPADDNTLCLSCHQFLGFATEAEVAEHTNHPVDPAGTGASRCIGCHMPALEQQAAEEGPHSHTLEPIPPLVSALAAEAGQPVPPNSCAGTNGCHDGSAPGEPVFDVNNPAVMRSIQVLYETWFPEELANGD